MRETKFRIFGKENQIMLDWDELINAPDLKEMLLHGHEEDAYYSSLMQFTGLKDKNGVEIYEGDIISDHVGVGVAEYTHSSYRVNYNDGLCKWFTDYLVSEYRTIEVIGNIYENPELLESR